MEEMERDFVTFTDDDGNDFELDVIDYFEYEGQEYRLEMELEDAKLKGYTPCLVCRGGGDEQGD